MAPTPDPLTITRAALLSAGSDGDFRDMLHNLLSVFARLEHVRARFGAFIGLTGVQFTLLITVRQLQGEAGVGVKELAEHLGLSAPFVTQETTRLVKAGVLAKATNPDDLRRVLLTLTDEGRERLRRLAPLQIEVNDTLFEPLDRADFGHLRRMAQSLRLSAERGAALSDYLFEESRKHEHPR